ncbi:MAG: thioesterase domain-containing protein [Candidatus Tectomicrobia bacterium]|nr:thioesterase domain-containing protein [Candidatus Tectomicrobia bacterium]
MKSLAELLSELHKNDIRLWSEGDRLRFDAPKGALTPELREELRARKSELLAIFQPSPDDVADTLQPMAHPGNPPLPFSLVEMHPGNRATPALFLLHPVGGSVLCYRDLAQHLGLEQPIYGLQARGLDGKDDPFVRLEEMAAYYLSLLQTVQPQGPYQLGGWSLGGSIAFEMAQQLYQQGQDVHLLAMIDTFAPKHAYEPDEVELVANFAISLGGVAGKPFSVPKAELRPLSSEEQQQHIFLRAKRQGILPPDFGADHIRHRLQVFKANGQAIARYTPQPYPGHITLFCTKESMKVRQDPSLGWDSVATGSLVRHEIPGDHHSIVRSQVLADKLRSCLH